MRICSRCNNIFNYYLRLNRKQKSHIGDTHYSCCLVQIIAGHRSTKSVVCELTCFIKTCHKKYDMLIYDVDNNKLQIRRDGIYENFLVPFKIKKLKQLISFYEKIIKNYEYL